MFDGFSEHDIRILPGFKPVTKPALKWKQLANGSYIVVDRLPISDIYESDISVYGKEHEINKLIDALEKSRCSTDADANKITLSEFNGAEKIFGAEIDYSTPITAIAMKIGEKQQSTLRGFSLKLTLRALEPPIQNIEPAFPQINNLADNPNAAAFLDVGYTADSVVDMNKSDTYTGTLNFSDTRSDSGFFEGAFTLKTEDMAKLRRFLMTNRGQAITAGSMQEEVSQAYEIIKNIKINNANGIEKYIFGQRRWGKHPFDVRITEWTDMGMKSLGLWQIKMKIVEEI